MILRNKIALINGIGSPNGKTTAILFAKEGAKLVISDANRERVDELCDEIHAQGGEAIGVVTNLAKQKDIQRLIKTAQNHYGTIDILMNHAGSREQVVLKNTFQDSQRRRNFITNMIGVMRTIRSVLPIFLEKKSGVIINNAADGGLCDYCKGTEDYVLAQYDVIRLTENIHRQLTNIGIRCHAIAPVGMKLNLRATNQIFQFDRVQTMTAEDRLARLALFLASDHSHFINDVVIATEYGNSQRTDKKETQKKTLVEV